MRVFGSVDLVWPKTYLTLRLSSVSTTRFRTHATTRSSIRQPCGTGRVGQQHVGQQWMNEGKNGGTNEGWGNERMKEGMNGWTNECRNEWVDEWMNEWMQEWMKNEWINQWFEGRMDVGMGGWPDWWMDWTDELMKWWLRYVPQWKRRRDPQMPTATS